MFNIKFPFYSLAILISLISNVIIVLLLSKKYAYPKNEIIGLLLYENVGIIVGAKVFWFIENYNLNHTFNFFSLGLSSYGAVIGAILSIILFSIQFKKSFRELLNIYMPSIPLMYSIGKIGCFLVGCCYGIEYDGIFKVTYNYSTSAPKNISLFPIQILESIVFFLIFIYMIKKHIKNQFDLGLVMCGSAKFLLDFLRFSHKNIILSTNQLVSIVFIIVGVILFFKYKRNSVKN